MWARRIGLPPLWPSRIKVVIMCMLYSSFLTQFFMYLVGADPDYLDLTQPTSLSDRSGDPRTVSAQCRRPASCQEGKNLIECFGDTQSGLGFYLYAVNDLAESLPLDCEPASASKQCLDVPMTLSSMQTGLSRLYVVGRYMNPFAAWAAIYLFVMLAMILSIMNHDLFLLDREGRAGINSRLQFKLNFPRLHLCIRRLRGATVLGIVQHHSSRASYWVWVTMLPLWICWQVASFALTLYPVMLISCLIYPRSLARVMVFFTALVSFWCSLLFVIYMAAVAHNWDLYSVFFEQPGIEKRCLCYCSYPLRSGVVVRVVFLATIACGASFGVAFRALRGLRQPNWASLFSVTYVIPVEAFPTHWESPEEEECIEVVVNEAVSNVGLRLAADQMGLLQKPCKLESVEEGSWAADNNLRAGDELHAVLHSEKNAGLEELSAGGLRPLRLQLLRRHPRGPVQHRKPGEDVQGEMAFDPFAMMEEQPNSAMTTVRLVPEAMDAEQIARFQPSVGDNQRIRATIGFFGFPRRHSIQAALPQFLDVSERGVSTVVSSTHLSLRSLEDNAKAGDSDFTPIIGRQPIHESRSEGEVRAPLGPEANMVGVALQDTPDVGPGLPHAVT